MSIPTNAQLADMVGKILHEKLAAIFQEESDRAIAEATERTKARVKEATIATVARISSCVTMAPGSFSTDFVFTVRFQEPKAP